MATSQPASGPEENSVIAGSDQRNKVHPAPAQTAIIVEPLDAGTVIEVAIKQPISSKINNSGDQFTASVAAPVMVGDKQVIPSGAKASGTIAVARSADEFKTGAKLDITLDRITVSTKTYHIQTAATVNSGSRHSTRTAGEVVVGGDVGPISSVLLEGGQEARIGFSAGASAGTEGAVFIGKHDFTLLPETKLTFRLTKSVAIRDDG